MPNIPTILCHERTDCNHAEMMEFFCPFCKRIHYHGTSNGHRVAHCHDENSPYYKTGYIIKLEYPCNKLKETIYSKNPKITIKTRWGYSYIQLELEDKYSFNQDGLDTISQLANTFFSKEEMVWRSWGACGGMVDVSVKKKYRFHIAQELLNIATNPLYVRHKTYFCAVCGTTCLIKENSKRWELPICDECKRQGGNE